MPISSEIVATLVAPHPIISTAIVRQAADVLSASDTKMLGAGMAADIYFTGDAQAARAQLLRMFDRYPIDVIVQPVATRTKKLLVADMDSTMITIECIDELADFVGRKAEVSAVTEAAMRGELDFVAALDARVALLKGLPVATLQQCYDERVRYSPGAHTLIQTMKAHGAKTVLVSGGFTFFTSRVRDYLGFASDHSNTLDIDGDVLAGTVSRPIVTADVKRATLIEHCAQLGLSTNDALAIGDGANDIPMIEAAGLGVAYRAKPKTEAAADASLNHTDLTALLYAMGIAQADWITSG
jgi:phosphoserine phosphatase